MRQAYLDLEAHPLPTLDLTSFTEADVEELRDLGAGDAMIGELRAIAAVPGRRMRLDFETQTVTTI